MEISFTIVLICIIFPTQSLGLISRGSSSEIICNGSIRIAHEDADANINHITLEGTRALYPNIRRGFPSIRSNVISQIDIFGECCWEIYPRRKFAGEKHVIYPTGDVIYTEFQPVSIKKVDCA